MHAKDHLMLCSKGVISSRVLELRVPGEAAQKLRIRWKLPIHWTTLAVLRIRP